MFQRLQQMARLIPGCKDRKKPTPQGQEDSDNRQDNTDELLFPSWPPPRPQGLLSQRDVHLKRLACRKYRAPEGVFTDTPLYSLYRIYEWLLLGHTVNLRNELESFWWARWPVSSIPDPGPQGDPERHAVLSCIPALLVESFNERIKLGLRREEPHSILSIDEQLKWAASLKTLETVPEWTKEVPPLESVLHIPLSGFAEPPLTGMDDPMAEPAFKDKNILMRKPHIHFI